MFVTLWYKDILTFSRSNAPAWERILDAPASMLNENSYRLPL